METGQPDVSDTMSRAEASNQQVSHFSERAEEPDKGFALLKMHVCFQTRTRIAQSARILELQIEARKLVFLAEFTKRARCEVTMRTTPTDEV